MSERLMDYRTHRPEVCNFLVNFGVFEWLYLFQYRPDENVPSLNVCC